MSGSRPVLRYVALVLVAVLALTVLGVTATYRRQIVSYLTHWKGPPEHTQPYEALPPADPPPLHLAVAGDVGDSGTRLDATAAAMGAVARDHPYDVLLLLGDNAYPRVTRAGSPTRCSDRSDRSWPRVPTLLAILGNHDVMKPHGVRRRWRRSGCQGGGGRDRSEVLLVGLDSNDIDDPEQLAWLEHTLASSDATWKIVAIHHPPYSAGYQGSSTHVPRGLHPGVRANTASSWSSPATTTTTSAATPWTGSPTS
jgi:hypothetical protein